MSTPQQPTRRTTRTNPGPPANPAATPTQGGAPVDVNQLLLQLQQLQQQVQTQSNVIAGLQNQAAAPATAPAPGPKLAVTPSEYTTGILDFSKKGDTILFKEATKSLYQDPAERYDLSPEHTQAFLNKVYDRCMHCNISAVMVPVDNTAPNGTKVNYCKNHSQFKEAHLETFAKTYLGSDKRETQDDKMMLRMLQESLSEKAYKIISTDRSDYTVDSVECGLLMLKLILERSSVDTNTDPDIIRNDLTRAPDKFVALHCDVKKFNEWFVDKVEQLKQNGILESELHWLKSLLFASYDKSTDSQFKAYIEQQKDYIRDHPDEVKDYSWKDLMSRASRKTDSILVDSMRASSSQADGDPFTVMQAQLDAQQKVIRKLTKKHNKSKGKQSNGGGSNNTSGNQSTGNKKGKIKFPESLKTKGRPSDPSRPEVHDGVKYYWCDKHQKWGRHKTSECKKDSAQAPTSNSSNNNNSNDDRAGRLVRAVAAVLNN